MSELMIDMRCSNHLSFYTVYLVRTKAVQYY